jgi:competence protein ComEC
VILNIAKDNQNKDLSVGTRLLITDQLVKNFKPNNPDQFDYGGYLASKGIYAQIYTEADQIKKATKINKDIWYYTSLFRNKIAENLAKSGFQKEELAVIMALILGQQQDISAEVLQDYQYAGAVHILSVSGLHVGFILIFIGFLLQPLPNTKTGNTFKIIITLLSLWLFAIIAGFSPSVVRSATMFSFIAIGKFINRETNSVHTTIVSLLVILLIEPNFLFDIGFQLSYLAVFFILWLQPIFQRIWQPKNVVIGYFWDIITISFAAQIGTLPLSIYYFHQFPGLFFITNLVLIPLLGFVIMPLGTLLIMGAFFNYIPKLLASLVENSIALMNQFISWIASLENFIWKEIPLNNSLLIVSYFTIIIWILWLQKPSFKKLAVALSSIIILQSLYFFIRWNEQFKN